MNGSGCKSCPVQNCFTQYRGSTCKAERAKHGFSDPMTNGDRIRAMTDEELAGFIDISFDCRMECPAKELCETTYGGCVDAMMAWLKQPWKGDVE